MASGTTTAFTETDQGFELESRSTTPARWVGVFAGRYRLHEATGAGQRYRVHSFAMGTRSTHEGLVRIAAAAVA